MNASTYYGPDLLILEGADLVESPLGVLDSLSITFIVPTLNWRDELSSHGYAKGAKLPVTHGFHSMWINELRQTGGGTGRATVAASCLGLAENSTKQKVTYGGGSERINIGPATESVIIQKQIASQLAYSDWFFSMHTWNETTHQWDLKEGVTKVNNVIHPAWAVTQSRPWIQCVHFQTTKPTSSELPVGGNITPPDTILTAPFEFTGTGYAYLDFRKNHPYGWILDTAEVDPLFIDPTDPTGGTGLWAVTRRMTQYAANIPM